MSSLSLFPSRTYHTHSVRQRQLLMKKYSLVQSAQPLLPICIQQSTSKLPEVKLSNCRQTHWREETPLFYAIPCFPILQSLNHFSGSIFHIPCQVQFHMCLSFPDPILTHPNCIPVHCQGYLSLLSLAMHFFPTPQSKILAEISRHPFQPDSAVTGINL